MPPPHAQVTPEGATADVFLATVDAPYRTVIRPRGGMTADYVNGRERILGSIRLHREPVLAASMLTDEMGPVSARAWLRRCLAELECAR